MFLAPPWPEIYVGDAERRHGFADAEAEYHRLAAAYARLGYAVVVLPKAPVADRVAFVLGRLALA
jgi:predicted ATPase